MWALPIVKYEAKLSLNPKPSTLIRRPMILSSYINFVKGRGILDL